MVLSSPPSADTTPDSSNPERVLQSLYCAVSAPFSPGTGELDATLLEKDSPLSSSDISGMNIPTMTTTPTEGSMIDRLRSVQQSGKSVGLMNSSGGLGVIESSDELDILDSRGGVVSNPDTFASLAAGGDSFDDQVLMDDHDTPDYPSFAVDSSIAPTITSLHNTVSAFTRMALRDRVTLASPSHFRSSSLVSKVERRVKGSGSIDVVKLLLVKDIGITICGGVIGASDSHAWVDVVVTGTTSCVINSHKVEANGLLEQHVYIRTPSLKSKDAVYLTPCLDI